MGFRHGHFGTPTYGSWAHMVARCTSPNDAMYPTYGGIGIKVSPEWTGIGGFERFLAHVGERPSLKHSIDRFPDRAGNYEPGNVRWATDGEQARNRKSTILVTIGGVTKCAKDWALENDIDPDTAYARIKTGWDLAKAVTAPVRRHSARRTIQ
jgi:hypothetical protein